SERVKSLFNVESGANFDLDADLPIDDKDWSIGVVVGPSGSGKSSIGKALWKGKALYKPEWEKRVPIIDSITPNGDFNTVTSALASVGLGSVPAWLRPYEVLSNGEQFRADLAKVICERPEQVVIDEFSSVVDRQIATIGAGAFQKAYRRTGGQAVLLTCHYDVLEWLEPDWVYDTATGEFLRGCLWRRPKIEMQIHQTNWQFWPTFEPHHYLKLPHMIAATNYVATVNGELVAHVAFSTRPGLVEARACRLVVMPEWQGAGVGLKFLNAICEMWRQGKNRYDKPMPTLFHTSHPGLCAVLRRHPKWTQVSANLYGGSKRKSRLSISASTKKKTGKQINSAGFGGHFRAVQGFRYIGDGGVE
ncbi:ABC transporter ATP-binding protein, partial [Marinomonas sp. S3726]|uniref:GNAT family N-acetyltransferase n=1 Tax=Marinomonas sp. S3726 TaxID=579484 RepID=UPI0005F9FCF6